MSAVRKETSNRHGGRGRRHSAHPAATKPLARSRERSAYLVRAQGPIGYYLATLDSQSIQSRVRSGKKGDGLSRERRAARESMSAGFVTRIDCFEMTDWVVACKRPYGPALLQYAVSRKQRVVPWLCAATGVFVQ